VLQFFRQKPYVTPKENDDEGSGDVGVGAGLSFLHEIIVHPRRRQKNKFFIR
jgi:hypothetical protein